MVAKRDLMTARVPGIGAHGVDSLRRAKILVVGAGGLGSPVLAYLAAAGIGTIGISDSDYVETTNLQRQVIHPEERLGCQKAHSAARTIQALNSSIAIRIEDHMSPETADTIAEKYDIVVDATDTFDSKYLLSSCCTRLGLPHVWGTLVGMTFQVSVFAGGLTLNDLYPREPPAASTPSSATVGVLGAVCGQAGSIMATEAIKIITGVGSPLIGKLLIVNAAAGKWNIVTFKERRKR